VIMEDIGEGKEPSCSGGIKKGNCMIYPDDTCPYPLDTTLINSLNESKIEAKAFVKVICNNTSSKTYTIKVEAKAKNGATTNILFIYEK